MAGLILLMSGTVMAGNTVEVTVTYEVTAINEISVSDNSINLTINAAVAGSAPTPVQDSSSTYAITTNGDNKKITGVLNTAMPSGVTLQVELTAPTGATSAGTVTLTGTAADLVTGISTLNESEKAITYTLSATSAAGIVESASKTVTFTISDGT